MIVAKPESELRLVTQPDHARIAAEILSLWCADGVPDHPRRDELLFAVREHDNGWQEADAAPRIDPSSGRPYTFYEIPGEMRIEIWRRCVRRCADGRPWPALLIATHADRLHRDRRGRPDWEEYFGELDQLLEELRARAEVEGLGADALETDYRWLRLADNLSLTACGAELDGSSARREPDRLVLDPFPFAGTTTFTIPCRHIPDRRYESDSDLTIELASAHWTNFKVRFAPE
jgi:hypothetical protein